MIPRTAMTYAISEEVLKDASIPFDALCEDSRTIKITDTTSKISILVFENIVKASSKYLTAMIESDKTRTEYEIKLPRQDVAKELFMYLRSGDFYSMRVGQDNFVPILINANYLQLERAEVALRRIFLENGLDITKSESFQNGDLSSNLLMSCLKGTTDLGAYLARNNDSGLEVLKRWSSSKNPDNTSMPTRMLQAFIDRGTPPCEALVTHLNQHAQLLQKNKLYYLTPGFIYKVVPQAITDALLVAKVYN